MKRLTLLTAASVVVLALLVTAVFVGARMLGERTADVAPEHSGSGRVMELQINDGSGPVSARFVTVPALELPDSPAALGGVFVRREDNSIFVGTGSIELSVAVEVTSTGERNPSVALNHDGPVLEAVVTKDTIIYADQTKMPSPRSGKIKAGEHQIQQIVKRVDSLDELGKNTELQVWGQRRGDRVVEAPF
ncbi:MAG: hypothetical protein CL878_15475 [Dehalococcoidia bacterium]|nr:hypothetical protein [Dehalococcoidia bacterium]